VTPQPTTSEARPPKLHDQVSAKMRRLHYAKRTEQAYVDWIKRYIFYHNKRHPREMGAAEIESFLTYLAVNGKVAASTRNQAFSALLFLYQKILAIELPRLNALRAQRPERLPVVLSVEEVRAIFSELDGIDLLQAEILYGAGLRILECCRLRVKDVDFARGQIVARDGKGPARHMDGRRSQGAHIRGRPRQSDQVGNHQVVALRQGP
jgi:integrase